MLLFFGFYYFIILADRFDLADHGLNTIDNINGC